VYAMDEKELEVGESPLGWIVRIRMVGVTSAFITGRVEDGV